MANNDEFVKSIRLIGYVRVLKHEDKFTSEQDSNIEAFAGQQGLRIVRTEHEISNGVQLMRVGVWRSLRVMACLNCPPKLMPMTDMYDYWFKEAMRPCTCKNPDPADGLIAENMNIICATPAQGAKFLLDMCASKKHLYVSEVERCLSCCNPQAIKFVEKQLPQK